MTEVHRTVRRFNAAPKSRVFNLSQNSLKQQIQCDWIEGLRLLLIMSLEHIDKVIYANNLR